MRRLVFLSLAVCLLACATVQKIAERGLDEAGYGEEKDSVKKIVEAARKGFQDLTPQEEYYIGRAVAAHILERYRVYEDEALTSYVNKVGMVVAWASDVPETYGGYHFLVLDTDEPLAYSAPGGFVFVSTGLLAMVEDEEELAGVLAHEVAHVNRRHGLAAIKQSRLTEAFSVLVEEGKKYSSGEIEKLANAYEGALGDVVRLLVEKGYNRTQESEADRLGALFAYRAGYNPHGLVAFLGALHEGYGDKLGVALLKTHPNPQQRHRTLEEYLLREGLDGETEPARTARFVAAKASLK